MQRRILIALLGIVLLALGTGRAEALLAMRVTNVSDFSLGAWNIGDPAVNASIDLCIYSYDAIPLGGYVVTVSSAGGFKLMSGANAIPYTLYWSDAGAGNLGAGNGSQLTEGVPLTGQLRANILSSTCALSSPNARLRLRIAQPAMAAALAGTYNGAISILVSAY